MDNKLYIIRGLPRSGKTTLARELFKCGHVDAHVEADMAHLNARGEYEWRLENLREAHDWCRATTRIFLRQGWSVVVANTFTRLRELRPYIEMCQEEGYQLDITTLTEQYEENGHNVPEATIEKMRRRFVSHTWLETQSLRDDPVWPFTSKVYDLIPWTED